MKYRYIIFAACLFLCNACTDFIEEENLSNVTAESFYVTAEGFESLVNANYAHMKPIYGGQPWLFCAGTDLYSDGRTVAPIGVSQYTQLDPSTNEVSALYNTCYAAIQLANKAIYYADLTEQTSNTARLVGEVKFLRANAYFLLVQTYGGVSLVTENISSPILSFDRNSAEEVYNQMIIDLNEALSAVGDGAYSGRVNKRAVRNLLAKVYLTRGYESFGSSSDFSTAASLADEVIGGQKLNLDFETLWTPGNDLNEETIFSVQLSPGSVNPQSTDPLQLGSTQFYYFASYLGGAEVAGRMPSRGYTLCPTDFALGLFTKNDSRWNATFMTEIYESYFDYYRASDRSTLKVLDFYEPSWFTAEDKENYLASTNLSSNFQYHNYGEHSAESTLISSLDYKTICVKKFDDPDPNTPFSANAYSTRDIVLARLGETYLIAAEAHLKAGNPGNAADRINEVRRRAGVDPIIAADVDIDFILDERGRELLGEYHRWFDLKRTGKLVERASLYNHLIEESNFIGNGGNLKILRPIPQAAIDLNQNKNFPQNPAYN